MRDGRIVEVMEVVGVEGSRVLFERFLPLHDTVLKRYRVATHPLFWEGYFPPMYMDTTFFSNLKKIP